MIHAVVQPLVEAAEFFVNPAPPPDRRLPERVVVAQVGSGKLGGRLAAFASGIALEEIIIGINEIDRAVPGEGLEDALHGQRFVEVVGAEVGEDVPAGEPESLVDRLGLSAVLLRDPTHGGLSAQEIDGPIGRSPVDHEMFHLAGRRVFRSQTDRGKTGREVACLVE